jgi:hypothetical protein
MDMLNILLGMGTFCWIWSPRRVKLKANIQKVTGEVTAQTLALISWNTVKRAEDLTALNEKITSF